jgi:hypothetical protein
LDAGWENGYDVSAMALNRRLSVAFGSIAALSIIAAMGLGFYIFMPSIMAFLAYAVPAAVLCAAVTGGFLYWSER